jgi:large subunit ribosomal protein L17
MRHAKRRHSLNRFTSWHKATLRSLVRNILIYQSVRTTRARAKAARPLLEKLVSLARENSLAAKREAFRILGDHQLVKLLFSDIGTRFSGRSSGFSRITGLAIRRGDNAALVLWELTEIKKKEKPKPKKEEPKKEKPQAGEEAPKALPAEEKKAKTETAVKEIPPEAKKPTKKFLGGIRNIFKKERDSL